MKVVLSDKQKEFQKLKRYVVKKVPGAYTFVDVLATFQVVDTEREPVVPKSLLLPPAKSVREAWEQARYGLWYLNMINKSNAAFSEEKMFKKLAKESGGGDD